MANKQKSKTFPITDKHIKDNKIDVRCMRCRVNVIPSDPQLFMYWRKSEAGNKIFSFRIAGKHSKCGTNLSKMISKELGLLLAKGDK